MNTHKFIRTSLWIWGIIHVASALGLLFSPVWFFENIGPFAPFNRHYEGDTGAFLLPFGLMVILAAQDPQRHYLVIGAAAAASFLHALNHIYDALLIQADFSGWLRDPLPLTILAIWMIVVAYHVLQANNLFVRRTHANTPNSKPET